jgi:hypothetical protein
MSEKKEVAIRTEKIVERLPGKASTAWGRGPVRGGGESVGGYSG